MIEPRPVKSLRPSDAESFSVWRFIQFEMLSENIDETFILPVTPVPVTTLNNCIVLTKVKFANGDEFYAIIGNIYIESEKKTNILIFISIFNDVVWVDLSRSIDPDYNENGPIALARKLNLPVDSIFPIHYDLRPFVVFQENALVGEISKDKVQISDIELMDIILS